MTAPADLTLACLCAGWCTTCQAYGATFAQLAQDWPQARFAWIDIDRKSTRLNSSH